MTYEELLEAKRFLEDTLNQERGQTMKKIDAM
jgi:hypothetical protein